MKVEFYIDPMEVAKTVVHDINNSTFRFLTPSDIVIINKINEQIKNCYPDAYERLSKLYSSKFEIVNRFLRCNFSVSDNRPDIDDDFNFEFECVLCPLKGGLCKDEGIICSPEITSELSKREIEIASYLADGMNKNAVADLLFISVFTVENHRRNIYSKLHIHTASELTKIAFTRGWIQ